MKLELADHQVDNPKSYDIGDIIDIVEDGQNVGKQISKTEWVAGGGDPAEFMAMKKPLIINLVGVSKAKIESFLSMELDQDGDMTSKKRLNSIDYAGIWSALPQTKKDAILNDREVTVTVNQIKNFLKRKLDGGVIDLGI